MTASGFIVGEFECWTARLNWLAAAELPEHGFQETARFTNAPPGAANIRQIIDRVMTAPGGSADAFAAFRLMCGTAARRQGGQRRQTGGGRVPAPGFGQHAATGRLVAVAGTVLRG